MSHNSIGWPFTPHQGGVKVGEMVVLAAGKDTGKSVVSKPDIVELFRHMRFKNGAGEIQARGGITFFFSVNFATDTLKFSVSVCRNDENFNKHLGNSIARNRFKNGCVFEGSYDRQYSLVDNAFNILHSYWEMGEEAPGYSHNEIGLIGQSMYDIQYINEHNQALVVDVVGIQYNKLNELARELADVRDRFKRDFPA